MSTHSSVIPSHRLLVMLLLLQQLLQQTQLPSLTQLLWEELTLPLLGPLLLLLLLLLKLPVMAVFTVAVG
jgi:hypothetical protein